MEDHRTPSASCEVDTGALAKQIREERERAGEYFSAQRETLDRLEREFEERADALHDAISQEWSNVEADRGELDLARQTLDARENELDQRELQHQQAVEQFETRCRKLDARNQKQETKLERREQALAARDAALQEEEEALRTRQREQEDALGEREQALAARDAALQEEEEALRTRQREQEDALGEREQTLAARDAALREEEEALRTWQREQEDALGEREQTLAARDAALQEVEEALRTRQREQEVALGEREEELAARDAALREEEEALSARQGELDEGAASDGREQVETQRKLNEAKSANEEAAIQIESLRSQCEALTTSLAEAEDRIAAAADDSVMQTQLEQARNEAADAQASVQKKTGDLKRRLELAIEEIAELKARNAELEKKLDAQPDSAPAEQTAAGPLDWEAQKRRLLAELDTEFNQEVASERQERLTIEQTIEQTDRAMADKDRQIDELKRQLDTAKSESSAAARAPDPVPQDEASLEQRERLEQLEAEWKEKLRKAEIDMSVERAKIAREKAQLDQRMQAYESQQPQPANTEGHDKTGRPTRGRWLARLGLSDTDE